MPKIVNMHEAKTTLSKLVEAAERGEEVLLARSGKPVVRLVAIGRRGKRKLGIWRGKVRMAPDFDAPLSESDLRAWQGRT